ncbi:hypothetical protein [Candidatus Laterigemmans baculatus]|uniref:hypothetical protein n=1 Tax=Candidatus Laterigemmans baculatus TaxID=2770505 RepID=UPI0013D8F595|nr:hypothetical protein [Candidatus Laterigemmans baculatus]
MLRMSAADFAGPVSRFAIALSIGLLSLAAAPLSAAEPAERFLEQLRSEGYYELAVRFLDRLEDYPGVPAEFLATVDLERAHVLTAAAQASRVSDQRDAYFAAASESLRKFVKEHPDHPRQPEAQLQLGNLLIVRGVELMELGGPPDAKRRSEARAAFNAAADTFNAIVTDLREKLKAMQGQKINAQDNPEKIAIRDKYRADYLQALLLGGDAMKRAAETFEGESEERTALYGKALERFGELSDKYSDELAGILAVLYAGETHEALGQWEKALDRYLAVLDQDDHPLLRSPKVKATTGLIRVYMGKQPPEPKPAVDRGQPMADSIRPDERRLPEWQTLRIELADAYLAMAEATEAAAEKRRITGSARELLLAASKVPGPTQEEASQRLAKLGIGAEPSSALEKAAKNPESFAETMGIVNEILEEERNLTLAAQLLEQRAAKGEAVTEEQTKARESLAALRARGIELLRHALSQADSETSVSELNSARASLAFLLYRHQHLREAAVVGSFVARRYPSSELALSSGLTALGSLQLALRDAEGNSDGLMAQIQELAELLVSQWPQDPQTATARDLLVRIAIARGNFDDARRFLAELPDDAAAKTELQQAMGKLMWNRAIELQKAGDEEAAVAMRKDAAESLAGGLTDLKADQVKASDLDAALLLARVQMLGGDPAAALQTLDSEAYGPLRRIDSGEPPREGFRGELYAVALQALVSQLTAGDADTEALMKRASELLEGLQKAYEGQPDGNQKLVGTYFQLARDIREQLDAAAPEQKQKLTAAFRLFLDSLATRTEDPTTLHWAAQTLLQLGQGMMDNPDAKATGQAAELIRSSMTLLEKIAQRAAEDPEWLEGEKMLTQVRLELGTAARSIGEYKTAIDTLSEVLAENPMLIDAQIEAALVYEQWAATLPENYALLSYGRAIGGAKPDPKTRRNTIWGWGTIARRTMGQKGFEETFFNARYHLALSRYLQAKKEKTPADAEKRFRQASEDIRNVLVRYPDMGGPVSRKKFDALLVEIQKALGKPSVGLAEFEATAAN